MQFTKLATRLLLFLGLKSSKSNNSLMANKVDFPTTLQGFGYGFNDGKWTFVRTHSLIIATISFQ